MTKQNYKYFPILQHYYIKNNIWQNKKGMPMKNNMPFLLLKCVIYARQASSPSTPCRTTCRTSFRIYESVQLTHNQVFHESGHCHL